MNTALYKTTGVTITALRKMLDLELEISGAEHLTEQPTLFAVNHFTRLETLVVPYVIHQAVGRQVRTLATPSLFQGLLDKYLRAVGVMSLRHPRRNRTIISQLMSGERDWVIYPEGRLVKNKKTVRGRRLQLDHPERKGPPHTGAAMLALKAEITKRRYRDALEKGDDPRIAFYREQYDLDGVEELPGEGVVVVPTNFTFYPLRPAPNIVNRFVKLLRRNIHPVMDEEMQVEGRILFGKCRMSIHFDAPIEVSTYLDRTTEVARRVAGIFSSTRRDELWLRRQATRLTQDCMRRIYNCTEINFDHLFCYGLRALKSDRVAVEDFHRALYVAAIELRQREDLRLHPVLENGLSRLITNEDFNPLDSVVTLAGEQRIVRRENGSYVIDRETLDERHDINTVRIRNTVEVIANELEPVTPAVDAVRRAVNLDPEELRHRTNSAVIRTDNGDYVREYSAWQMPGVSRSREDGAPFYLEAPGATVGVVLSHGYLSTPRQIRPLAEYLHASGVSVYGVRLAGHGTSPQQLTDVRWREWMSSLRHGYAALRPTCERIIMGGFSLGGVLALIAAANERLEVDGAFAINAPMRLRDRRAPLVPALVHWNQLVRRMRLGDGRGELSNHDSECPDLNYNVDYLEGVRELRRAVSHCRGRLADVRVPTLVVQADGDPVVAAESGPMLMRRLGTTEKDLVTVELDRHDVLRGPGSDVIYAAIGQFLGVADPESVVDPASV